MGLSLDSILGSLFFYLTALHLFHLYAAIFLFTFIGVSYTSIFIHISSAICVINCSDEDNFFYFYFFQLIFGLSVPQSNDFSILGNTLLMGSLQVIIPPRWIRLATGNFTYWISVYSIFIIFYGEYFMFSVILYLHFVFIIWMVIDFSLNL